MTDQHSGADSQDYRIEHDTMGEVRVPVNALYGAQTQRAVENFPISGSGLEPAQIVALARIKRAAAIANKSLGILEADVADAIVAAADEVVGGAHHDQFPVDTYQTGSGTYMTELIRAFDRLGHTQGVVFGVYPDIAVRDSYMVGFKPFIAAFDHYIPACHRQGAVGMDRVVISIQRYDTSGDQYSAVRFFSVFKIGTGAGVNTVVV